jgi:shikimate kinase
VVLATGGGAACREDNLQAMLAAGFVVALSAPPAEVLKRTGGPSGRPNLDVAGDPLTHAQQLLAQREPFYARAHLSVDTVGKAPQDVAEEIERAVGQEGS